MRRLPIRVSPVALTLLSAAVLAACASGGGRRMTFTRLVVSGAEIREAGYSTAYEALTHHRELIVFEDRLAFEGGDDRSGSGRDRITYTVPLLVVNGDFNMNDAITELRQIPSAEIVQIRLYYTSMLPPEYRRPGAEGGVIEVTTR
ncbi:MAG: hypothetical protein R3195_11755 [Gemmatimonadota bacterium]|nr:hypothetical protein [Gemmatimonadota bacterium]